MKPMRIKPSKYVKANAADVIRELKHAASYQVRQERLAFLRILALGRRQVDEGETAPADELFRRLRKRRVAG